MTQEDKRMAGRRLGRSSAFAACCLLLAGCSAVGGGERASSGALYKPASQDAAQRSALPPGGDAALRQELDRQRLKMAAIETALSGLKNRQSAGSDSMAADFAALSDMIAALRSEQEMLASDVDLMSADLDRLYERVAVVEQAAGSAATDVAAVRKLMNVEELTAMGAEGEGMAPQSGQQYAVHLASYRSKEAAGAGWKTLTGQFPASLGGLETRLDPLDLGGGDSGYLRLLAGPFGDVRPAREICEAIRAKGGYCQVTIFRGDRLD